MTQTSLQDAACAAPRPYETDRAETTLEALREAGAAPEPGSDWEALLIGAAGCSPFLARLMTREAVFVSECAGRTPEAGMAAILAETRAALDAGSQADLMKRLRVVRGRAALFIALADLGGVWPLSSVLQALSDFADAAVCAAVTWLLRDAAARGRIALDPEDPVGSSGLAVLALGKLGAHELNYSSDIDLILFFDQERRDADDYGKIKQRFNQLTRDLVKILSEITGDGYVFRVDLRLRPDPGSTAPCLSMDAAERYYESFGKNWERAAFIKARPIAGDMEAGRAFLEGMRPFVWRRTLDYATIEDVRDMKRLIHRHKGHGEIRAAGHDIKVGRGGIREIEFFAQTQQLIAGGREKALRIPATLDALKALTEHDWVSERARDEMSDSYIYLRTLEHRLQMVDDAQTQTTPSTPEGMARIAAFMGVADAAALERDLRFHLERVAARFARLFEDDGAQEEEVALFLPENPERMAEALSARGFNDPEASAAVLARWPRLNAAKSERARAKLGRIAPRIVESAAAARDPDRALLEFDRFLNGLPAGVQIFSLFEANPNLLDFLTEICAAAPRLAAYLGRNSKVLDAVLERGFFELLPDLEALETGLVAQLEEEGDDFEGVLNAARRWSKERHFKVGAQLLRGVASPGEAARGYSDLAEASLRGLAPAVTRELARRHGPPPGEGACVIAMGRLGAREMTAGSDLDLLVIYDDGGAEASDGPRPLAPTQYYARWTQRLVAAMTAPTAEGALYEVDMRLRPSGRSGPLATRLASFERYQAEEAWTWEHMALTRARVVYGPPSLTQRVEAAIARALSMPRDAEETRAAAVEMRERLAEAKSDEAGSPWAVKLARGGLVDVDFILQSLLLTTGAAGPQSVTFDGALAALSDVLDEDARAELAHARGLQAALLQIGRLALEEPLSPDTASPALRSVIARAVGVDSFNDAEAALAVAQTQVKVRFEAVFSAEGT